MKRLIVCMSLMVLLLNQTAIASCNWKTGIVKIDENTYQYTKECHGEVGVIGKALKTTKEALEERKTEAKELRAEVKELKEANQKYVKSIELKDLAIVKSDEIALKWRNETYNQHDRLLRQEKLAKFNSWAWFGGGVALTILSVWATGQINRK